MTRDRGKSPDPKTRSHADGLSADDLALWNKLANTTTPLAAERRAHQISASPPARPVSPKEGPIVAAKPGKQVMPVADRQGKTPSTARSLSPEARIDPNLRRRLQKNRQPIEATLDLHGLTLEQAHKRLAQFVAMQCAAGHKFVLLVTGKGVGGNGVLRRAVPEWLNTPPLAQHIVAFGAAAVVHGGSGALYVHLRSTAPKR